MDKLTPEKRSWNMGQIKGKNTAIEVKVRHYLFDLGFRYRKHVSCLPGKPDIVLPKYKTIIFVHGCFWHRHQGCKCATTTSTRTDFWARKFQKNVENDKHNEKLLLMSGWQVVTLWECDINKRFEETMEKVVNQIRQNI